MNSVAVNCSSNATSGLAVHQLVDETFFNSGTSVTDCTKILFYCCGVATRTELVCAVGVRFHTTNSLADAPSMSVHPHALAMAMRCCSGLIVVGYVHETDFVNILAGFGRGLCVSLWLGWGWRQFILS
jgi:hypothetical protein